MKFTHLIFLLSTLTIGLTSCSNGKNDQNLVRMDVLASELNRTNEMLEKVIGLEYINFYDAENYDSLKFGGIVRELDQIYLKVIEQAGGFEPGYAEWKLFDPSNTRSSQRYLNNEFLKPLRTELQKVVEQESDEIIRSELDRINSEIFGKQLSENTAAEFRLRYFITKNRLYLLEQMTQSNRR